MKRRLIIVLVLAALAIAFAHTHFFYFRDNFSTHYPLKAVSAEAFRSGTVPFWNGYAGGGQPLAGNPNLLTFYPDNVLYLLFGARAAFNLHFLLHLAIAFFAMRALCSRLGAARAAANVAALIYVASGVVISTTAFYNLIVASALVPALLAQTHAFIDSRSIRDAFSIGVIAGLLGLAGEPVIIAASGLACLILLAGSIPAAAALKLALSGLVSVAVAAPQLIAYSEVAPLMERAFQTFSTRTVLAASLGPWRAAEIVFGPFLGFVTDASPAGYSAVAPRDHSPILFISVAIGSIALVALAQRLTPAVSRYRWIALGSLFIALGSHNPLIVAIVDALPALRFARYPEKLLIHGTIAIVALIALWMSKEAPDRRDRIAIAATSLLGVVALTVAAGRLPLIGVARLALGVGLSAAVLLTMHGGDREPQRRWMYAALTLPLLWWAIAALPLERASNFAPAPRLLEAVRGQRVWRPAEREVRMLHVSGGDPYQWRAVAIDPLYGAASGVRYALDRSPEGMYSYLSRIVSERVAATPLPAALTYAQIAGCTFLVSRHKLSDPRLTLTESAPPHEPPLFVYSIRDAAAPVEAARQIIATSSINEAVATIETRYARGSVTAPPWVTQTSPAKIVNVHPIRDGITFDVSSEAGSVIVINQSYAPGWSVRTPERSLAIFPANIDRLGVVVPPGEHRVTARFGKRRGVTYAALALSLALIAAQLYFVAQRSMNSTAAPAR